MRLMSMQMHTELQSVVLEPSSLTKTLKHTETLRVSVWVRPLDFDLA